MKIVRDIEQGTPEWFALRAGKVTGSNFGKVLAKGSGATRRSYMLDLIAERWGAQREPYTNAAMEWGTQTEPQARAMYELMSGDEVEEVTLILHSDDVSCSPDGLVGNDGGIEIKCPNSSTHVDYRLREALPSAYKPQVQGFLWIAEREWCDFVSFDPRVRADKQFFCVRVYRDEAYIKTLAAEVERFVAELLALLDDDDTVPGLDDIAVGIQEVEA